MTCRTCGTYVLNSGASNLLGTGRYAGHLWSYSAVTRRASEEGQLHILNETDIDRIPLEIRPPSTPLEVLDQLLDRIATDKPMYGDIALVSPDDYPLYRLRSSDEMKGLVRLASDIGLLIAHLTTVPEMRVQLSTTGWARVADFRQGRGQGVFAFVAMSFDTSLNDAYDLGIRPAIEACGFTALRVDRAQYNDKIDDRIVADLRRSRFVVADVTMHRQGVYFEAGFGLGRGLDVIYTCRADDIGNAHFDTRQYNHIVWSTVEQLRERLRDRIEATVGIRITG
jgi:hypothetical protein